MEECELNKSLQQNQEQWQKQVASVESLLKQRDEVYGWFTVIRGLFHKAFLTYI